MIGRTGRGKSTLINSILELQQEIAPEGASGDPVTQKLTKYGPFGDFNITFYDTPGLQGCATGRRTYLQFVDELKRGCGSINVILYCVKMNDLRIENDDLIALRKLSHTFGPLFWERVIVVLTFANKEDCEIRDDRDEDDCNEPSLDDSEAWNELLKNRFIGRINKRKEDIKEVLSSQIAIPSEIVNKIKVIPAGTYKRSRRCLRPLQLPDRKNWLVKLLRECCSDEGRLMTSKLILQNSKLICTVYMYLYYS